MSVRLVRRTLAVTFLVGSAIVLSSSDRPVYSKRDKAAYAAAATVNFVRPGLVVKINSAKIAADGTISLQYTITDPKGLPLDQAGVTTPGAVTGSAVVAYAPHGQDHYVNYVLRTETSPSGATAKQPTGESLAAAGQLTANAPGQYTFTFKNKAPAGFDATATHTVGVYVTRNLTEFDLSTYTADDVFNFVPNGSPVKEIHDQIRTQTCNKCHDPLSLHGGPRHSVALCVLCHTEQYADAETGNPIDMKVMIHKIHMGSQLPSVVAGTPYQIVGFQNSVNDYSDITFPADIRNCTFCHEGSLAPAPKSGQPAQGGLGAPAASTAIQSGAAAPEDAGATTGTGTALVNPKGAACGSAGNPGCNPDLLPWPPLQANWWMQNPNRAACGSCHDNVNFTTGANHVNLPETSDTQCVQCHIVQGELPFDASIVGAHTIPQFAPGLPGVVFKLVKVDNGAAGKSPTVTFTLADKSGNAIQPSTMNFLNLVMAGPTGDYQNLVSEDARTATAAAGGGFQYTFKATVPAAATGTFSVGIEGYKNATLLPGTLKQMVVRDVGFNDVLNFSVDGSALAPHPVEITQAQCNACHFALSLHGTIRQNVQYCLLCHNPTATDAARRPAAQKPDQSIDLPVLIHRIHVGGDDATFAPNGDAQLTPFVVYGFGGSANDFGDIGFPARLNHCDKCHSNNADQVPVPATRIAVTNPRAYLNPSQPTAAACTACHLSKAASSHALANTTAQLGESCEVCHGANAEFAVDKVHADTQ